ncbi:MAG: hypothetical protein SGJ21_10370 [Alphaproteobacteria bacterium]|nr:hypothetical protein [Alphaproteobacteria bacterium]
MRLLLAAFSIAALPLAGCERPDVGAPARGAANEDAAQPPVNVDTNNPYAGEWASAHADCGDNRKIWTIESRRMAILPSLRFCAFKEVFVNADDSEGGRTWSASAQCLAEGRESRDFLFFRLDDNLQEMRVTFNDGRPTDLVRCSNS